ncbi:heme-dependent oxidative N-demethylase family protein [Thioclava kandeliae]|uniref:DUF3445 domain-containing protein n=1 Tax=Thioclava kandeliae TaxID=3070818 RepID=A0ABV1SBQ9_9RHOB
MPDAGISRTDPAIVSETGVSVANWPAHGAKLLAGNRARGQLRGMEHVLQSRLSFAPWADPRTNRLPGIVPLDLADWIEVDDAYAGQMALREALIAEREEAVHALLPQAEEAARELYGMVLDLLPAKGYRQEGERMICPDGRAVLLDAQHPLLTLGRLTQNDFCLMQDGPSGEHLLTGAILCFPAGWQLSEKIGRPMMRIHKPVEIYTEDLGRRVQRLLDGVQPGRALMRGTASRTGQHLFDSRPEAERGRARAERPLIRVERQGLVRLPLTRAVVFSIHTQMVHPESLSAHEAQTLETSHLRLGI